MRHIHLRQHVGQSVSASASTGGAIDMMLSPVLDAFGAADVSQLPAAVGRKYEEVKKELLAVPGLTGDQLASAMGPAIVNGITALAQHNPAAATMLLYRGMESVMSMGGGPIGSAAAAGLDAVPAIVQMLGGTAHGAADECQACTSNGQMWYGGWDVWQHKAPVQPTQPDGTPDPRWIKWDNKTTHGPLVAGAGGSNDGQCADDLPTVDMGTQGLNRWVCTQSGPGTGYVSGQFLDLPYVLSGAWVGTPPSLKSFLGQAAPALPVPAGTPGAKFVQPFPKDGFDYAVAHTIMMLLEQYMNAQGPRPVVSASQQTGQNQFTPIPAGPGEINLRDVIENMVWGWNATHEPGTRIQLNTQGPTTYVTSTWQGKTSSMPVEDIAAFWQGRVKTGDFARRFIMNDPRAQDVPLYLNTGPLLQSIRDLYGMMPTTAPPKKVVLLPIKTVGGKPVPSNFATHAVLPPPIKVKPSSPTSHPTGLTLHPGAAPSKSEIPPPIKPSPVGMITLIGASAALAYGVPYVALPILGVGAIVGLVQALRS